MEPEQLEFDFMRDGRPPITLVDMVSDTMLLRDALVSSPFALELGTLLRGLQKFGADCQVEYERKRLATVSY